MVLMNAKLTAGDAMVDAIARCSAGRPPELDRILARHDNNVVCERDLSVVPSGDHSIFDWTLLRNFVLSDMVIICQAENTPLAPA
jgi:hypothetical protein